VLNKIASENDSLRESKEVSDSADLIQKLRSEVATLRESNERLPADDKDRLIEQLRS
jgi:hypothetical protein